MIAILAWGSLIWKPEQLPYGGSWRTGGPKLPLEFSRITSERPLTLVLDPICGVLCPTRYAWSLRTNLSEAIDDLKHREGTSEEHIGYIDLHQNQSSIEEYPHQIDVDTTVRQWCYEKQIPSVVWTAIPPNFTKCLGIDFSVDTATQYLKSLSNTNQESVLEYIRNTPSEIETPVRSKVAKLWSIP